MVVTIKLAADLTLPAGRDYFFGVDAKGDACVGADALGIAVPKRMATWSIRWATRRADPNAICRWAFLWSTDKNSEPRRQLPPNGGCEFRGDKWLTEHGLMIGDKWMNPAPLWQRPYPRRFVIAVRECSAPMRLDYVHLLFFPRTG